MDFSFFDLNFNSVVTDNVAMLPSIENFASSAMTNGRPKRLSPGSRSGCHRHDLNKIINVEATDKVPAPFFVGKLETEDGDITCVKAA